MGIVLALVGAVGWLLITIVVPIASFVRASRAAAEAAALRGRVAALEQHLRELIAAQVPPPAATTGPTFESATPQSPSPAAVVPLDPAVTFIPQGEADPSPVTVAPPLPTDATPETGPHSIASRPADGIPPAAIPLPTDDTGAIGETSELEEAIGGRLLLYVGTVVLVLGAAFFLKYAFDRAWITETMRVVFGALAGFTLVAGGLRFARAGYATYGQVLTGGGLAVLYLATYAAFGFYGLIGSAAAFTLLTLVTLGTAVLADRQNSQPMAVMAIGGGFLTPFLVGG